MDKDTSNYIKYVSSDTGDCFCELDIFAAYNYYSLSFRNVESLRGRMFRIEILTSSYDSKTLDIIHSLLISAEYSNYLIALEIINEHNKQKTSYNN